MPKQHQRILLYVSVMMFVICTCVHFFLLQGIPHVVDENSYLLQARIFADNQRVGAAFPLPEMFLLAFWNSSPESYSAFPFGWPLLMSFGERVGLVGLVNPLCAAILPWLTYKLTAPIRNTREALIASLLVASSPGIWILGGSLMSHTSCLVACLGIWVALHAPRPRTLIASVCFSYLLWARPFEGVFFGVPLTLWAAQANSKILGRLSIGYFLAFVILLFDNHQVTGSLWTFPINDWFDTKAMAGNIPMGCNRLGFGDDVGCIPTFGTMGHSFEKAILIAQTSLLRLEKLLLGISGVSIFLFVGLWRWRGGWRYLLALLVPVMAYACYWSPGSVYGARFYHTLYLFLPMLLASGFSILPRYWPYVVILFLGLTGGSIVGKDLQNGYHCVDGSLVRLLRANRIEGTVFLDITDNYTAEWPALLSEPQHCSVDLIATGVVGENRSNLLVRQLPRQLDMMEKAPKPHYVLQRKIGKPVELLRVENPE